jgi:hypothetical protein
MNENIGERIDESMTAWKSVGETMSEATRLYMEETNAYLEWTKNMQKEALEYYWAAMRVMANATRETTAFVQRLYETTPTWGQVPKGTETISGMVGNIVRETKKE